MNIIVQENIDSQFKSAIEELFEFLPKAGVKCSIATQPKERFISLGFTGCAKTAGFDNTIVAPLKDDGFIIKTIDGNYYILAKTGYGILYGVYTFLEQVCSWKVYGVDELQIGDAKFIDLDIVDNPTFDFRECVWHAWSKYDPKFSRRLRIHSGYWITPCHSTFEILPPTKYYKEHKDWYSESRCQICFTNEGAFEQYVENSISVIKEKDFSVKKTPLMMVGQEDANGYCQCETCKADYKKYGGISGVILRFVKKLSKRIDAYMEENFPDVTMKYVAFAYGETTKPPVDDDLSPVHESVKAGKNMGIYYAPLAANWSKPLMDETYNADTARTFNAYKKLGYEAYVWPYDSIFDDEFIFFDQYKTLQIDYKTFRDMNCILCYDMGHKNPIISFDELNNYVRTKMMWNVELDVGELISEFMDNYYKESSQYVKEYFDGICSWQAQFNYGKDTLYSDRCPALKDSKHWDKAKLEYWIEILTKGIQNSTNRKIQMRIERERITPIYLLLECFAKTIDKERLEYLIDTFERDCKENGIVYGTECGSRNMTDVESKLVKWRSLLLA